MRGKEDQWFGHQQIGREENTWGLKLKKATEKRWEVWTSKCQKYRFKKSIQRNDMGTNVLNSVKD